MRKAGKLKNWGTLAVLGAGLLGAGCKSAPELTQANATSMIQANYDQSAPVPLNIVVNDLGMQEGLTAKYWQEIKRYPNGYWADFKLTPDGKKLVKLSDGTDVIQWRLDGPSDPHYAMTLTTIAANRLKPVNIGDAQDDGAGKSVAFSEDVNMDGMPVPLQGIAQNPGNQLSTPRHANFVLANGAWKLDSIK
ncbi:MAG TPA: hypothetical protein VGF96_13550 [Terracidiphilus sp.]